MTPALGQISIYKPTYYMRSGSIVRTRYINSEDTSGDFPVTDSCERSATVMNEDYVKLSFKLLGRVVFDAFAYIWYDNQLFFLKETYRPTAKGAYYQYDMKFVSIANMFDKHLCFRYLSVPGEDVSPEPEINMNGTLDDMAAIVIDSIHGAASRLNVSQANLFYVYVLQHLTLADDTQPNTTLETFSFSGQYIPDVLTQIASKYEIEWWVSQESMTSVQLHLCKCERGDTVVLSDRYRETGDSSHPYASRGLVAPCEYAQEWSNIPQKIIPFGSDRNITRKQALQSVNGNDMYVSYGKQLRLAPNHTYTVKDREGNSVQATTDALGAFTNTAVRSGIETTKQFDNIYPRCHFRVLSVKKEGTEHPIYTITAAAIKADGESLMSYDEMVAAGLLPLQIEPNETLSIIFESGYLNGREFEVAYDIKEVENVVQWTLKIVPEEGGDDGVQLPFGNFVPREKSSTYEGDMFAIFHMVMPQYYIERAQDELAQAAYDELLAIEDTRPEVKCKTEPEFFANQTICLGQRVAVHSELFGEIEENAAGEIEPDSPSLFVSRVTSFTHSLTKPNNVEFKLASSRVEGRLAEIEAAIADRTSDIRGLEQRSLNLSRRGWHDAAEMLNMLESLAAEMMVIGVEKNQFAFTPAILCVNGYIVSGVNHFDHLHISAGYIQHTQEPYIKYANGGRWDIDETDLTTDEQGNTLVATTPYYLYAICGSGANTAQVVLTTSKHESDTDYLLMGILSSEFLDDLDPNNVTSYRVFNRSNGYTQITGGTITTEQIQDPTRSLIIDLSSNPPRIIAVHGAEIIGNITFKSFKDENGNNVLDDMNAEINKEIGGENLYTGVSDFSIPFDGANRQFGLVNTKVIVEADKHYVVSTQTSTCSAYSGIYIRVYKDGSYINVGTIKASPEMQYISFRLSDIDGGSAYDGGTIYVTSSYGGSSYARVTGFMIQHGQKPTTYHSSYQFLAEALEHDATMQITDINGGLVATSLIKLRDQNGNVTAGVSGLKDSGSITVSGVVYNSQGVGFWCGGDYSAALSAACGVGDMPVLLTKTGIGSRIGCFRVVSATEVQVVSSLGTIRIDTATGGIRILNGNGDEKIIIAPKSITGNYMPPTSNLSYSQSLSGGSYTTGGSYSYTRDSDTFTLPANSSHSITLYVNASASLSNAGDECQISLTVKLQKYNGSSWVDVMTIGSNTSGLQYGGSASVTVNTAKTGQTSLGNTEARFRFRAIATSSSTAVIQLSVSSWGASGNYMPAYSAKTVIGTDGILNAYSSDNYFYVKNDGTKQTLFLKGLQAVSSSSVIVGSGEVCSTDSQFTQDFASLLSLVAQYGGALAWGGVLSPGTYMGQSYSTFEELVAIFLSNYKYLLTK